MRALLPFLLAVYASCAGTVLHKSTGTVAATPAVVSADIGKCFLSAETSDPALVKWVSSLFARPDATSVVTSLLTGPLAQAFACAAGEVATMGRAGVNTRHSKGALIEERANQCMASQSCDRVELQASRLLRDLAKRGVLKLPPSGEG